MVWFAWERDAHVTHRAWWMRNSIAANSSEWGSAGNKLSKLMSGSTIYATCIAIVIVILTSNVVIVIALFLCHVSHRLTKYLQPIVIF